MAKDISHGTILGVVWKPTLDALIGIVALETTNNTWQAFIGVAKKGRTPDHSVEEIIAWGAPLSAQEAYAFFPDLPLASYNPIHFNQ
jgi:hypothetical protein